MKSTLNCTDFRLEILKALNLENACYHLLQNSYIPLLQSKKNLVFLRNRHNFGIPNYEIPSECHRSARRKVICEFSPKLWVDLRKTNSIFNKVLLGAGNSLDP